MASYNSSGEVQHAQTEKGQEASSQDPANGLEGKGYKKLLQFRKTTTYTYYVYLTIFPAKTVDFQVFI